MESEPTNTWRLSLVRGQPGLPRTEFLSHWLGPHRDHISALEGVQATRFFVVDAWTPSGRSWDGLGLIGFATPQAARTTFDDPALKEWIAAERAQHFGSVENAWLTMAQGQPGHAL
jgi:hypothetical protein